MKTCTTLQLREKQNKPYQNCKPALKLELTTTHLAIPQLTDAKNKAPLRLVIFFNSLKVMFFSNQPRFPPMVLLTFSAMIMVQTSKIFLDGEEK